MTSGITARTIIKRALQICGQLGAGVSIDGDDDEDDAFLTLTGMLDTWAGSILRAPVGVRVECTLTAGTGEFTLGPSGADLTGDRPVHPIDRATRIDSSRESPLRVLTRAQEQAEVERTSEGYTDRMYVDHLSVPYAVVKAFPVPSSDTDVALYFRNPITAFADLTTTYYLAEGYYEAILYNLAIRLGLEHGLPVHEDIKALAAGALDKLTARNEADNLPQMELDPGLVACEGGPSGYDWMTGEGG